MKSLKIQPFGLGGKWNLWQQILAKGDGIKNILAIYFWGNIFTSLTMIHGISMLTVFSGKIFLRSLLKLFVGSEVEFKE